MRVTCQEVIIKFRSSVGGHNNQRITLGDGGTSTQRIAVTDTGERLMLAFMDKDNQVRKVIAFPMDVVQEYSLDRCDTVPAPKPFQGDI
jgi:hypothetical protein